MRDRHNNLYVTSITLTLVSFTTIPSVWLALDGILRSSRFILVVANAEEDQGPARLARGQSRAGSSSR